MEKIKNIISAIEAFAPSSLQESWDNAGLIVGNPDNEVESALISLDVTEEIVDDAIRGGEKLIIAHHPIVFSGLKRFNGKNYIERSIIKAIKNDIAIYAAHTNIDVTKNGVSWRMAEKLGLQSIKTLIPEKGILKKLVVFVPITHIEEVQKAVFEVGAGKIGNYDYCGFNAEGKGSFRAKEGASPFVGSYGELHYENEVRFETVFPGYIQARVIGAMLDSHPYEEVAYDVYTLDNAHPEIGLGVIGELSTAENSLAFLKRVKNTFQCDAIKYTAIHKNTVKKIALLGGAGSSYLGNAKAAGADVFISGDFKYHQFFDAENKIIIADIGHYESEQYTKELFYEIVTNKFSKFALRLSEVKTNPINYLF